MLVGVTLAVGLALAAVPDVSRVKPDDPLRVLLLHGNQPWQVALRDVEPLERWHQVHWVPLAEASRIAQEQHKPLLLSISSGSLGQAHAPFL